MKYISRLNFSERAIRDLVREELLDAKSLLITDGYSNSKVNGLSQRTVLVADNNEAQVEEIRRIDYSRVIAIGGCTALDIGRACAGDKMFYAIPTILSTSCISVGQSVLADENGKNHMVGGAWPDETIISLPDLESTEKMELARWVSSGMADYFANITSARDRIYRKSNIETAGELLGDCWEVEICIKLKWVSESFHGYDMGLLRMLANWLHDASLRITNDYHRGRRKTGGEHKLYYAIKEGMTGARISATHGQIVSIGTLMTARILRETCGDFNQWCDDYSKMSGAWHRLGLPTDYGALETIGICKERIIEAIKAIRGNDTILEHFFSENDFSILDRIYDRR